MQYFGVGYMHPYLVWKHYFGFLWTLSYRSLFISSNLFSWSRIYLLFCVSYPLHSWEKVSSFSFLWVPFLLHWVCDLTLLSLFFYQYCNCLFYFKGFLFLSIKKYFFSKKKYLKDLVLFMKTKTFNVCIKTMFQAILLKVLSVS